MNKIKGWLTVLALLTLSFGVVIASAILGVIISLFLAILTPIATVFTGLFLYRFVTMEPDEKTEPDDSK